MQNQDFPEVIFTEKNSPSRAIFYGESFLEEKFPVGTRIIYPRRPVQSLGNPRLAIRHALENPLGGKDPLRAKLRPGMKLTIAIDDISLPLPMMAAPDIRQLVLEEVLTMAFAASVDDIHIIIARGFRRRMKPAEIRHVVGDKIFRDWYPKRLYDHDGEDTDNLVILGETRHGEKAQINRRCADSDLLVQVSINLVPMDGGHKAVSGLSGYQGLQAHHNVETIRESITYMDPDHSALHTKTARIGKIIEDNIDVFHIEAAVNTRMFQKPFEFLGRPEETWSNVDWAKFRATRWTLDRVPFETRRQLQFAHRAPYGMMAVVAGETNAVHREILEASWKQYAVKVQGQADILVFGIPFVSPYSVNSITNPLLVQVLALGFLFNMIKGSRPLLKKGGTIVLCHPCYDRFDPEQHPSSVEFFNRVLPETRDAKVMQQKFEKEFAENPLYIDMYRNGHACHGVHPFYTWYWGENGRQHAGRVIAAGANNTWVPKRMGWEAAPNLTTALQMAQNGDSSKQITYLHVPPIVHTEVEE